MKYFGKITDVKDLVTKEYVDGLISGLSTVASSGDADDVTITDSGENFNSSNVEGALAELADAFSGGGAQVIVNTGGETPVQFSMTFTTSSWLSHKITVSASTHGCGTEPMVQVQTLSGTSYKVYHGYPSESWTVSIDSSGNITLSVASGSEFSGRLVVR